MRNRTINCFALVIAAVLSLGLCQSVLAKGKPVKVEVTNADPSEAAQGQELDVVISGSGFDSGSSVSYLVTGTTDDTQVTVESVEYVSPTELKTHVTVHGNAAATDYDIEVQNSSGRKGKGTTLFRVKAAETACTGFESREPEFAYLTGFDTSGDVQTQDLYLSSGSGCDQYLLLEDAVQALPIENGPAKLQGEYLSAVDGLRLALDNDLGVVIWTESAIQPSPILGLLFSYDTAGHVTVDPAGPIVLYSSTEGADAKSADVRFNDSGELELVVIEFPPGGSTKRVVLHNPDTPETSAPRSGCLAVDLSANCYSDPWGKPYWSSEGSQIFLQVYSTESDRYALVRFRKSSGTWNSGEVLMTHSSDIKICAVSPQNSIIYRFFEIDTDKKGKIAHRTFYTSTFDVTDCDSTECEPADGTILPIDLDRPSGGWTRSGGLLFLDVQAVDKANIREYLDPLTVETGRLSILNVDYFERDTAF
ncbi:MAG: hypothetical protein PVG42_09320 [Lysobacterales bacterium]|jgi:hypothetical protein